MSDCTITVQHLPETNHNLQLHLNKTLGAAPPDPLSPVLCIWKADLHEGISVVSLPLGWRGAASREQGRRLEEGGEDRRSRGGLQALAVTLVHRSHTVPWSASQPRLSISKFREPPAAHPCLSYRDLTISTPTTVLPLKSHTFAKSLCINLFMSE